MIALAGKLWVMGCSASLWLASPSGRLQGQSYHNVCDSKLITHNSKLKSRKRESLTEFCFRSALSSVFIASFAFVLQMHRAKPIPLFHFSAKNTTHIGEGAFLLYCTKTAYPNCAYERNFASLPNLDCLLTIYGNIYGIIRLKRSIKPPIMKKPQGRNNTPWRKTSKNTQKPCCSYPNSPDDGWKAKNRIFQLGCNMRRKLDSQYIQSR